MATLRDFGNWKVTVFNILNKVLDSEIFQSFSQIRSHEDRVKFIFTEKLIKQVEWLPSYFEACRKWHGKSSEKAKEWKDKGNKFFQQKNYVQAVDAYTQSCLNAPVDVGDDYSLSLGNRSAALYYLEHYQECIIDINRAMKQRFPSDSLHKLLARKTSAYIRLKQKKDAEKSYCELIDFIKSHQFCLRGSKKDDFMKEVENMDESIKQLTGSAKTKTEDKGMPAVSFGKNSIVSQATDAVTLRFTEDKGRHLLANRHIPVGSNVIVERPFAAVLLPEHYETHCHHCFFPLPMTCLGCTRCTTVRFCSEKCHDEAWSSYHKTECPYLDLFHCVYTPGSAGCQRRSPSQSVSVGGEELTIHQEVFQCSLHNIAHLSLRIILSARLEFLTDFLNDQMNYRQSGEVSAKGINSEGKYDRSYLAVYDLMTHEEGISNQDMLQYSLTAAVMLTTLAHAGFFDEITNKAGDAQHVAETLMDMDENKALQDLPKDLYAVGGLILHHILQIKCNSNAIASLQPNSLLFGKRSGNTKSTKEVIIGSAIYPTADLINHSCDPTINFSFVGDVLVVAAVKGVNENEEISYSYIPDCYKMSREERQKILKRQYHFDCKCKPCCGDFSQFRFRALKCPKCAGVLSGRSCTECSCSLSKEAWARLHSRVEQITEILSKAVELMNNQDYNGAVRLFQEGQSETKKLLYKDHMNFILTESSMASCYEKMGEFSSSADHLMTAMKFIAQMYGDKSIQYSNMLTKLITILCMAERFRECFDAANKAVSLSEALYGSEHENVRKLRSMLDMLRLRNACTQ